MHLDIYNKYLYIYQSGINKLAFFLFIFLEGLVQRKVEIFMYTQLLITTTQYNTL